MSIVAVAVGFVTRARLGGHSGVGAGVGIVAATVTPSHRGGPIPSRLNVAARAARLLCHQRGRDGRNRVTHLGGCGYVRGGGSNRHHHRGDSAQMKNVDAPNAVFVMSRSEFRRWEKKVNSFHAPGAILVVADDEQLAQALRKLLKPNDV